MTVDRTPAPFGRRRLRVAARETFGPYVVLAVADPDGPAPDPGQFAMLAAVERWGGGADERPFLPRAFSVARRHAAAASTSCSRTSARGRSGCARSRPGRRSGCSGRSAAASRRRGRAIGRCSWAGRGHRPADDLGRRPGDAATTLLGFRDAAHAAGAALIPSARVATDDGSAGHHGLVTELLAAELGAGGPVEVYACGPPPMLEAVRALCAEHDVPAQLALESGMACGFGACFGCVVPTRDGYVRLCVDGPVLDAGTLAEVG